MSYKLLTSMSVIAIACFTAGVNVGVYLETPHESLQQEAREEVLNQILTETLVKQSVSLDWEISELNKSLSLYNEIRQGNLDEAAKALEMMHLYEIYKILPQVEDALSKAPPGLDTSYVEQQVKAAKQLIDEYNARNGKP